MKIIKSIYVKVGDREIPVGSCKLDLFILHGEPSIIRLDEYNIYYKENENEIIWEK